MSRLARIGILAAVLGVGAGGCASPPVAPGADTVDAASGQVGDDASAVDAVDPAPDAGPDAGGGPDLVALCGAVPVTFDDWERCHRRRICEYQLACVSLGYRDVTECMAHDVTPEGGSVAAEVRERRRAVEAGLARVDVAAFTRCLVELDGRRCETIHAPSCVTRYAGTIPDGDACHGDIECAAPGGTCARDCGDACCAGTCERRPRLGEACDGLESCEPGLRCALAGSGPGARWECVSGDIGSSCASTGATGCDANAWCNLRTGRCEADVREGDLCRSVLACADGTKCVGLQRDVNTARCMRVREPGDACDRQCRGNLRCLPSGDPQALGQCAPLPEVGEACSLDACLGLENGCVDGRCRALAGTGTSCAAATCRPGLFCSRELGAATPVCAAPQTAGAPCTRPEHCDSYLCSGDANRPGQCLPWAERCPS